MRVLLDGVDVDHLDPKITRRLDPPSERPLVEGVVVSADHIIDTASRRFRIALGVVGGIAAAILIVAGIAAIAYEPRDLIVVGPLYLVILGAMGWGAPVLYRRSMTKLRDKTEGRLARLAAPGTALRLDAGGLTVGGVAAPWSDIAIRAVEIVTEHVSEGPDDYRIEALLLDVGGRPVVLDVGMITSGAEMVAACLYALRVPWPLL